MSNTKLYKEIGKRLKDRRVAKGLKLSDVASSLYTSVSTISNYECGKVPISIDKLVDYCILLNLDIRKLFPDTTISVDELAARKNKLFNSTVFVYWYDGLYHVVREAVIESDISKSSKMFYGIDEGSEDIHKADFYYEGTLRNSEIDTTYLLHNINPPFDSVFLRIPSLSQGNGPKIGIMSTINSSYRSIAIKFMASEKRITDRNAIKELLIIDKPEIRYIKYDNMLIE